MFKLLLTLEQSLLKRNMGFLFLFPPNPVLINKLCCASTPQVVSDFKIYHSYSGLCKPIWTHGMRNSHPPDMRFIRGWRGGTKNRCRGVVHLCCVQCPRTTGYVSCSRKWVWGSQRVFKRHFERQKAKLVCEHSQSSTTLLSRLECCQQTTIYHMLTSTQ